LYKRLARPNDEEWAPWGTPTAQKEDEALGRLVQKALDLWKFEEVTRLQETFKRSGFTLLMAAAAAGRVAAVRALLDEEVEAASSAAAAPESSMALARDAQGRTAAHHAVAAAEAAEAAVVAILERLLEAAGGERRRLLTRHTKGHQNLLHAAATRGGGPVEEDGPVREPAPGDGAVLRFLLDALGTEQATALAAQEDADGRAPLAVACGEGGHAECLALLDVTPRAVVAAAEVEDGERAHVTVLMKALARCEREPGYGEAARYAIRLDWGCVGLVWLTD
jgi:hypothetical protein